MTRVVLASRCQIPDLKLLRAALATNGSQL